MTTLTLLVHLKSHSSSIKTPVKILHESSNIAPLLLRVWGFVRRYLFVDDVLSRWGIPDSVCVVHLCNNPTLLKSCHKKKHSEIVVDFNDDSTSSDDDSPYGEDIDYVDASPPDAEIVSSEVVEIVIPKVGGIDIEYLLNYQQTFSFSSSTSPNLFLEETNTVDKSLPETKTFCFNLEEISSGSLTSYSDLSLPDYEAFYLDDNHVKEKSSGSTTTHADFSQYDSSSLIFDQSDSSGRIGGEPDPGGVNLVLLTMDRENVSFIR
ncbi:hypothetical protein Tco_0400000 [Tanacetum coccineum]